MKNPISRVRGSNGASAGQTAMLSMAAVGIVFGDIGTSPLYVLKVSLNSLPFHQSFTNTHVLGILSLITWSLFLVVTVKYLFLMMRMDHRGEGGVLSMVARGLANRPGRTRKTAMLILGMIGGALLLGDGFVTPAISVLSATENFALTLPNAKPYLIPLAISILVFIFIIQRYGTGRISTLFGPIMILWFLAIAVFGLIAIINQPDVLKALNPIYAFKVIRNGGWQLPILVGAIVLCVTGAESLYADMGHFGRTPIRLAWLFFVWPCLMLAYFGQGAMVISDHAYASQPFLSVFPDGWKMPMIILGIFAAIIASQAVITGLFSISRQAMQMSLVPSLVVKHTSSKHEGRIYVPFMSRILAVGAILLVLVYQDSGRLANLYGVAVTGLMLTTTLVFLVVSWPSKKFGIFAIIIAVLFLVMDIGFFASTSLKITSGGWVPLLVAFAAFVIMVTWLQGRRRLEVIGRPVSSLERFRGTMASCGTIRTPGTGVFLAGSTVGIPRYMDQIVRQTHALPERVVLLTMVPISEPYVDPARRVVATRLADGFWRIRCRYGFLDEVDVSTILKESSRNGLEIDPDSVTYFMRRWQVIDGGRSGMSRWRVKLFSFIYVNSIGPATRYTIPSDHLVLINSLINF